MSIRYTGVSYVYAPKTPAACEALKDVDLTIKDGSFTFIVGHTGSGKSTLIQMLNGLLCPSQGTVEVGDFIITRDKKTRTKKLAPLRKKVGIVFQFAENQLFEDTLEKDVAFGPRNFGVKKDEALLTAHKYLKAVGFAEEMWKKSPLELSGGEKRLAAIAGILALEPDILVLDEPTAGLDPDGVTRMMALFQKLNDEGKTIIIVTHDMDLVLSYASEVILLHEGRVAKVLSPQELFLLDLEKYSLATPMINRLIDELLAHGLKLDLDGVRDLPTLVSAIKTARERR